MAVIETHAEGYQTINADTLTVGDRFIMRETHLCTVLREAEPWTDPFGRTEGFIKIWCSTEDREGYVMFGPGGYVGAP